MAWRYSSAGTAIPGSFCIKPVMGGSYCNEYLLFEYLKPTMPALLAIIKESILFRKTRVMK